MCFSRTHQVKVFKQSHLRTPGFFRFHVNNLISAAFFFFSFWLELELKIWQCFKFLGLRRRHPTSLKCRLLPALGHFYHETHYVNRQSRGPLCQRAAAAFRGSVQDHQVLMSQERNQHTDITHFTLSRRTPLNYTWSTQVHLGCQLLDFAFFAFSGKAFNLRFTVRVACNGNRMIAVMRFDAFKKKKGELALQTGCSATSPGSVSVFGFSGAAALITINTCRCSHASLF